MNDTPLDSTPPSRGTDPTGTHADPDPDRRSPSGSAHGSGDESPTARALVRAARDLFARRGYDGTSIRAITTDADANLGAVTYHFGSKRALYEEVLRTALAPLRERVVRAAESEGTALDRVGAVVRSFFEHLAENPDMPQLMLQEIAAGKTPPPPVEGTLRPILGTFAGVIGEGQASGEIRRGAPPLMALSCVAQPVHLTLVRRWIRHITGVDLDEEEEHERVVEHAVAFARRGLAARPEEEPTDPAGDDS